MCFELIATIATESSNLNTATYVLRWTINELNNPWVQNFTMGFLFFLAGFVAPKFGRFLKTRFEPILCFYNTGIVRVFINYKTAENDIEKELQGSKSLKVLTSRGGFLHNNHFIQFVENQENEVMLLLPHPTFGCPRKNWVKQRVEEMARLKGSGVASVASFQKDLSSTITKYLDLLADNRVRNDNGIQRCIYLFDTLHFGKIIILDKCAYFTPYLKDKFGMDGKVYKYKKDSDMYKWLEKIFTNIKEFSMSYEQTSPCSCELNPITDGEKNA